MTGPVNQAGQPERLGGWLRVERNCNGSPGGLWNKEGRASKGREVRLVTEQWAVGGGRSTLVAVPRPGLWG